MDILIWGFRPPSSEISSRNYIFFNRPQDVIHPPRIPSKNEYQRYLHESYQYIVHLIVEQQRIEEERIRENQQTDIANARRNNAEDPEDIFANVKRIRERLRNDGRGGDEIQRERYENTEVNVKRIRERLRRNVRGGEPRDVREDAETVASSNSTKCL